MELKSIFIGIVVFAMLAMGMFGFMNSLLEQYEDDGAEQVGDDYEAIYKNLTLNDLGDIGNETKAMTTSLESGKDFNPLQFFLLAPRYLWAAFTIIFKIPGFIISLVGVIGTEILGEGAAWAVQGLFIIVAAFVGFAGISALIKWRL